MRTTRVDLAESRQRNGRAKQLFGPLARGSYGPRRRRGHAVRGALDGLAAGLAAHSVFPAEIDHLRWLNTQLRDAAATKDFARMLELNIEFHEAVCQAGRNALLLQFIGQIHGWVRRFPVSTFSYKDRTVEANDEGAALITALQDRDADEPQRIARAHMERALQVRITMLQKGLDDTRPLARRLRAGRRV